VSINNNLEFKMAVNPLNRFCRKNRLLHNRLFLFVDFFQNGEDIQDGVWCMNFHVYHAFSYVSFFPTPTTSLLRGESQFKTIMNHDPDLFATRDFSNRYGASIHI
jgi:hypothetical protein